MDDDDHGLLHDCLILTERTIGRRRMLRLLGAASLMPLVGCAGDGGSDGDDAGSVDGGSADADPSSCTTIPAETAGPYPGDGTNGANALELSGIVRSDIRSSIGTASGTAAGIAMTVTLTLVDTSSSCAPLAGRAIYLWHCDRDGAYSMYSGSAQDENYLRGVQETDDSGQVTFTTIFPACYSGRWPHMHFEVYDSLAEATSGSNAIHTSQLALPEDVCVDVYATAGYEDSVGNLSQVSLDSDNVFGDGADAQTAAVTGSTSAGYAATLRVAV